jgi:hypothetical protein
MKLLFKRDKTMKTKSFEEYLKNRLSKEKITEIELKADREARSLSTYDIFYKSLNNNQQKKFDEEYRELLISELLIATAQEDTASAKNHNLSLALQPYQLLYSACSDNNCKT